MNLFYRSHPSFAWHWPKYLVLGMCVILLCLAKGDAFAAAGIQVRSLTQVYQPFAGYSQFDGNVELAMAGTEVKGPHADFVLDSNGQPDKAVFPKRSTMVRKNGGVQQTIQADSMQMGIKSGSLQAQGRVTTQVSGDPKVGDITIQSDTQIFDQEKHIVRAIGNVQVKKQDMQAKSPEALIFLGPSGAAEKVVFMKGAQLTQADQNMKAETITIKIDTGDIFAEKNTESVVSSTDQQGNPSKVQIKSHLQELDKATGTLIANGNAVVNYDDYVAKGPKAVFYRVNNNLDRIVMTGRAEIEDPERKVTGDTVVIKVNPRQFNAQGNVTTFIKAKKQTQTASAQTTTKGSKSKPQKAAKSAAVEPSEAAKGFEQEMMIENAAQGDSKRP